jgi:hypothetical protein
VRQAVNEGTPTFGPKGISRNKKTRKIISEAHVHHENEIAANLAQQIMKALTDKIGKNYPAGTVLIIHCITDTVVHDAAWQSAIEGVRKAGLHTGFGEVFLVDRHMSHSTTL